VTDSNEAFDVFVEHALSVYDSESVNTFSPSFHLDVEYLLQDFVDCDHDDELSQVRM